MASAAAVNPLRSAPLARDAPPPPPKHTRNHLPLPTTNPHPDTTTSLPTHALPDKTKTISYYVENLPNLADHITIRDLVRTRWKLANYGKLTDVFIPRSKNKAGKRYGFIRFSGVSDELEMEKSLDRQKIGASPLNCSICRFDRRSNRAPVSQQNSKRWTPIKSHKGKVHSVSSPSRPFVSPDASEWPALPSQAPPTTNLKTIALSSLEENNAWLAKCLIGVLKRIEFIPEIQVKVKELGWNCVTRILGGSLICLEFDTLEDLEMARDHPTIESKKLFYSTLPWQNLELKGGRCVWIQCRGIPLQAWGAPTFKAIANSIGNFVVIDEHTAARKRLDVARILVTANHSTIDCQIKGELNGQTFLIQCKEEPLQGVISSVDWLAGTGAYEVETFEEEEEEEECEPDFPPGFQNYIPSPVIARKRREDISPHPSVSTSQPIEPEAAILNMNRDTSLEMSTTMRVSPPLPESNLPDLNVDCEESDAWGIGRLMGFSDLVEETAFKAFDEEMNASEAVVVA